MKKPWISTKSIETSEHGKITLDSMFEEWKFVVMLTDKFTGGVIKDGSLGIKEAVWENLLELRVFDGNQELRIFRESIGDSLRVRLTDDSSLSSADYFDETMLLNINRTIEAESVENGTMFSSVSGGKYVLPADADCDVVKVRNYVIYDETGTAQAVDFRITGFAKGVNENG